MLPFYLSFCINASFLLLCSIKNSRPCSDYHWSFCETFYSSLKRSLRNLRNHIGANKFSRTDRGGDPQNRFVGWKDQSLPKCCANTYVFCLHAYLVPVLTGFRKGRGELYRQCQSKTMRSTFAVILLTALMVLYFSFLLLCPVPPQSASLADGGRLSYLLLSLIGLVPCGLMHSGPMPSPTNRHNATLQGQACYPLINKEGWKTGRSEALWSNQQRCWRQLWQPSSAVPTDKCMHPSIQPEKQHSRQAMTSIERCTSVSQNKRKAWVIRVDTLLLGTTPSPASVLFQM